MWPEYLTFQEVMSWLGENPRTSVEQKPHGVCLNRMAACSSLVLFGVVTLE